MADVLGMLSVEQIAPLFDSAVPLHVQETVRPCPGLRRLRTARGLTRRVLAVQLGV